MKGKNDTNPGLKGFYGITFFIGLGFFTMGLMDPLYDTYVPIFLNRFIESKGLIGIIMTLDNIFAILLIPVVSALSDRTRTSIGRRMPYIISTLPLTAIIFGFIPFTALNTLAALIVSLFFLNIFKQAARGPVVALMPDMVPGELRSEANGVINTMGGIAAIVGTLGLAQLMNVAINLPGRGPVKEILAFPVASLLVLISTILLFIFVKEKRGKPAKNGEQEKKTSLSQSLKMITGSGDKSTLLILLSLLFWFIGYQGVLPFIGLYSTDILATSSGTAAFAAGMVGIAYAIFAIPSGIIAHRRGRKTTIRTALLFLTGVLLLVFLHDPVTKAMGLSILMRQITFWALMFFFGMFWVTVITNSFPMLWQMATYSDIGIYTGLYYFFSQLASIIAPPITGGFIDLFGFRSIFLFAAICIIIAFFIMGGVKRGEAHELQAE
ncbi:MAG: MFS transporter [Spirochaetales bacterium]|nr:MFS transporter [Spirochaetales bacterium]